MRIGVDACCWGNKRGFGRFTRELLEAILELDRENEYLFFIDSKTDDGDSIPKKARKVVAQTAFSAVQAASAGGRRSVRDLLAMSRAVLRHDVDVFFFPAVYSYFPVFNRAKIVVTVHDLIADHHPEKVFPDWKSKIFWKAKQNAAIRQADLILTVSQNSKREIEKFFALPQSRLRVVNEAARPIFKILPRDDEFKETLARYGLSAGEKFLLYVGGISPHKNLDTLLDAFARVNRNQPDIKLVLVGDYKDDPFFSAYPTLKKQTLRLNLENRVIFTGFVPDTDLARFYNACEMLVFPSLEEGFGLPAIEAMACGAPVAASVSGSLPEVLGAAGRFFNPLDAQNMANVIELILTDAGVRRSMRETGLRRVEDFQWKKAAEDTLKIFDELAVRRSPIEAAPAEVLAASNRF